MATIDATAQLGRLESLRDTAGDPQERREFLLQSSMIAGLRVAEIID
jgi:hypothetical protein